MNKFTRKCPQCNSVVSYTTAIVRDHAEKKLKLCRKCAHKGKHNHSGINNPFYGKTHSKEVKERLAAVDRAYTQTDDFKKKCTKSGKSNGMYGKSVYDTWLAKYGKEEADRRREERSKVQSEASMGAKNNMYGKPSPIFSGNGWKGWCNGWFFRSLRELSYVINILEVKKLAWKSAEGIRILYIDHKGHDRTYTPDFLVENHILVEIKPKRLKKLWDNQLKKIAAVKYCKEHGLVYKMFDVRRNRLTIDQLIDLVEKKTIKLTDKSIQKLNNYIDENGLKSM